MCQFFSKTEDQCSKPIKQVVKEAFQNNMHQHDIIMKRTAKSYLNNRECSVQERVKSNISQKVIFRKYSAMRETEENLSSCLFC